MPGVSHGSARHVVSSEGSVLRVRFEELTIAEQEVLTMVLYSRADSWLGWGESRESDNVHAQPGPHLPDLHASAWRRPSRASPAAMAENRARSLACFPCPFRRPVSPCRAFFGFTQSLHSQQPGDAGAAQTAPAVNDNSPLPGPETGPVDKGPPVPPGQYRDSFTLNDAGSPQIELHGIDSQHSIYFTLPQTHVVRTAKIHVYYAFSPSLLPQLSHSSSS